MSHPETSLLLLNLQQAFDGRSWHGTNLWGSIRAVDATEAGWRPQPERHSVWELVVHAAYWKYRVFRVLSDAPPRSFGISGSNFFPRSGEEGEEAWEADRAHLKGWHERLLEAAGAFPPERLDERVGTREWSYRDFILGAAAHDVYHAGQIQLLKRLRSQTSDGGG